MLGRGEGEWSGEGGGRKQQRINSHACFVYLYTFCVVIAYPSISPFIHLFAHSFCFPFCQESKTLIHNKKKAIFQCKTEGYNPNQDALHQLARHQQTIIFRLRTGHCRLNSHLKRIGVKTSAQCPCGEADQTPEHYLQSCSLHQQARQQIWPTCVSLKTKLWGSAEDLFPTSRYAALTGERI